MDQEEYGDSPLHCGHEGRLVAWGCEYTSVCTQQVACRPRNRLGVERGIVGSSFDMKGAMEALSRLLPRSGEGPMGRSP